MTRKAFIENSLAVGMGLPFLSAALGSCSQKALAFSELQAKFSGKVIIIGAGAAALSAAFLLKRQQIKVQVIEAAPVYGGRLKKMDDFADFPIDLGAEWIHTEPSILNQIANKPNATEEIGAMVYNPQTIKNWKNEKLKTHNYIKHLYSEWKFKRSTWFDFFEQYILPEVADEIRLNSPVAHIEYKADDVRVTTTDNEVYTADKVLLTVPIKILQNQSIRFSPSLPKAKQEAIDQVFMGDGIKIFVEFKEKFYPDILAFGNIFKALREEEKFVYDAAFGKVSQQNILGLFAINEKATAYTQLSSEKAIINQFLDELDDMFEGKARPNYVQHIIQNWSEEPYIQGAYSYSFASKRKQIIETIQEPLENKIYFAGEALSLKNQATVHGAYESAYHTVAKMLEDKE